LSLLACISSLPSIAQAASTKQKMVYEVYAGGMHALQAELTIDLENKDRYSTVLFAKTRGFLGTLVPWYGTFESHGWNEGEGRYRPELHKSTSIWRDEEEIKEYTYGRDGTFKSLVIMEAGKKPKTEPNEPELTNQTIDVLTATLAILEAVATGEPCTGSADVFDGKRRFEQKFNDMGSEILESSRYNIYEGVAQRCTVEVVPKGGKWYDKPRGWLSIQEQGRSKGTMPTVWIAKVEENAPAIPVKLLVKTDYGALFMHLSEYQGVKKTLIAENRMEATE